MTSSQSKSRRGQLRGGNWQGAVVWRNRPGGNSPAGYCGGGGGQFAFGGNCPGDNCLGGAIVGGGEIVPWGGGEFAGGLSRGQLCVCVWGGGELFWYGLERVNALPNDEILVQPKLKALADDKINVTQILKFVSGRVENSLGKGENAGHQHRPAWYDVNC